MSPLIHPVGLRLNLTSFWRNKLHIFSFKNFSFEYINYINIDKFLQKFFRKYIMNSFGGIYSHATVSKHQRILRVHVFLYDGKWLSKIGIRLNKRRTYKYIRLKKTVNNIVDHIKSLKSRLRFSKWLVRNKYDDVLKMKLFYVKKRFNKSLKKRIIIVNPIFRLYSKRKYLNIDNYFFLWKWLLFRRVKRRAYSAVRKHLKKDLFYYIGRFFFGKFYRVFVTISFLENFTITSYAITKYMVRKLRNRYTLNELIGYIKNVVAKNVTGLRLKCSGRFTRRQRASVKRVFFGRVSLNTFGYGVDYHCLAVTLKYGVGGIKVWLSR
jgi:hypothetical protein